MKRPKLKAQPPVAGLAICSAASLNIWEIFNTLKAAEMFIAIHKPTPYSDGCECGACRVTRTLNNVREVMRQNGEFRRAGPVTQD